MPDSALNLVQLTDCHLVDDPEGRVGDVDTFATLEAVVDEVRRGAPAPDAVLVTGDLSQDGMLGSYWRIKTLLQRLAAPAYCLPGNHDENEPFAAALPGDGIHLTRALRRDGWQVVFLDSTVAGEEDGALSEAELAALDEALGATPELHALVTLHHPPVAVGGAWLDQVSLANPDDLFAVLDRHAQVRGVLFGHVHQVFEGMRGHVRLMASPSTCFQFVRDGEGLGIGDDPPGYRRLALGPDGAIESAVHWLAGATVAVDS